MPVCMLSSNGLEDDMGSLALPSVLPRSPSVIAAIITIIASEVDDHYVLAPSLFPVSFLASPNRRACLGVLVRNFYYQLFSRKRTSRIGYLVETSAVPTLLVFALVPMRWGSAFESVPEEVSDVILLLCG